jgi:hypothetical protein
MDNNFLNMINWGVSLLRFGGFAIEWVFVQLSNEIDRLAALDEMDSSVSNYSKQVREILAKVIRDVQALSATANEEYRAFLFKYLRALHALNLEIEQMLQKQLQPLQPQQSLAENI